jgi:hypothetical protein
MQSFTQFFLEYRHNYADGTKAQSLNAHNGKGGGIGGVGLGAKIPYIVGDREEEIKPGVYMDAKMHQILGKIGANFEVGKVLKNYKNSGNDCIMKMGPTGPMIQIIKGIQAPK